MVGKIISIINGKYLIYSDGITYSSFIKGIFRYKKERFLVGDNVVFDDENFAIQAKLERKNELVRPLACNIDQIFIVMSMKEPNFSKLLLYKFITYINMNNIPVKVILSKCDLLNDDSIINELIGELNNLGIDVFSLSKNNCDEIDLIKKELKDKTSIFMGQTGVGKSSLINLIDPLYDRKIGEYSTALGRGKHQTKEVILLPYNNGFIGDTPGFSSIDLNIYKEDLSTYFPGFNKYYNECYFSNCLHLNEKECMIKKQIENGVLSKDSYTIYLKLLDELPYKKERYK